MHYSGVQLGVIEDMAFVNANGENISYECSKLIEELKEDITEFGGNKMVAVWCRKYKGVVIYTNYDFMEEDLPFNKSELKDGESLIQMTMSALLVVLEQQNSIF